MMTRRDALQGLGMAGAAVLFRAPATSQERPIDIAGQAAELTISSISAATVRVTLAPKGAAALNADGALVDFPQSPLTVTAGSLRAGSLSVFVSTVPLVVRVSDAAESIAQELRIDAATGALEFSIGDAPLLAFGEGGPQFDRRGSTDAMRNGQGGYQLRTHGGRVPIQWLIGTRGWGLFIHQPLGTFDLAGPRGHLTSSAPLPLDVFIVISKDPTVIMREYGRLTGLPEVPPLWAFGYQQSHRTLAGPEEVIWVARTLREKRLPCDALIYLGTDFTPSGWNTHNGEFSWNPKNFPDPAGAITELHDLHYKVVLHTVIEGKHLTGTVTDGCATPEPSGRTPDGQWPDERSVGCYWPHHKGLFDLGIDGCWPDQGDGFDPSSRLNRIRMYWQGSQLWRPNERPYALHRNGYAGMARYGAFLWSGDVYSTWETLRTHVPVGINTGLSGIPYWGTDIGGFVPTPEFTGELYVRWFQFGAFCPLFRAHGRTWHLRLPWGWNTGELGPNETSTYRDAGNPPESELHNAHVEPICRKYLELRSRLMPYLYSAIRQTSLTGLPVMRALWIHDPEDSRAVERGDEYLWGPDILVAPVTDKGATTRRLYLPRGAWYDFWTNERVNGGVEIDRHVDLETIPLYVRAGAIIPLGPVRQYVDEPVDAPLTFRVYPGASGTAHLFEDEGRSLAFRSGDWMGLDSQWDNTARRLSVRLTQGSRMRGARREIVVELAGTTTTRSMTFSGAPLSVRL
jgi:alpha-glucosidase (family GH31 glycosyl hydrolase)